MTNDYHKQILDSLTTTWLDNVIIHKQQRHFSKLSFYSWKFRDTLPSPEIGNQILNWGINLDY